MFSQEAIPFWTAVAAVAAAGSALVAAAYTYLTYRIVQIQGEPKVIVYVKHDPRRFPRDHMESVRRTQKPSGVSPLSSTTTTVQAGGTFLDALSLRLNRS